MKLLAFRTRRRAELWLFDAFGVFVALFLLQAPLPGRFLVPLLLMCCCRVTRVRVLASDPTNVRATSYWFVLPIWWTRVSLHDVRAGSMDDWAGPPDDMLQIGDGELPCRHASRWVAWLRASADRSGLPRARVVR